MGIEAKVAAKVGSVGVEGSVTGNALSSEGQLQNPLTHVSGGVTGTLNGDVAEKTNLGGSQDLVSTSGSETTVGGSYGEGIMIGLEVSTGLGNLLSAIGDTLYDGARQTAQDVKTTQTWNGTQLTPPTNDGKP